MGLFQILSAILHLGNVEVKERGSSSCCTSVSLIEYTKMNGFFNKHLHFHTLISHYVVHTVSRMKVATWQCFVTSLRCHTSPWLSGCAIKNSRPPQKP